MRNRFSEPLETTTDVLPPRSNARPFTLYIYPSLEGTKNLTGARYMLTGPPTDHSSDSVRPPVGSAMDLTDLKAIVGQGSLDFERDVPSANRTPEMWTRAVSSAVLNIGDINTEFVIVSSQEETQALRAHPGSFGWTDLMPARTRIPKPHELLVKTFLDGKSPAWPGWILHTCARNGKTLTDNELGKDPKVIAFANQINRAAETYETKFKPHLRTEENWEAFVDNECKTATPHPHISFSVMSNPRGSHVGTLPEGVRKCKTPTWLLPKRNARGYLV